MIKSQLHYKKTPVSRIYSQQGIQLHDDDVLYLRDGETLYYDYKGRDFDSTQIVDQYAKETLLGQGGFGSVYRGRHKETGQLVALKYIDLTDQCNYILLILCREKCEHNFRYRQRG